jgi:hypothetical protein
MRNLLLAATICATTAAPTAAVEAEATEVYGNARYGYSICYPAKLLVPQDESGNGDGRKFLAQDGSELAVWGEYNVHGTLDQVMADRISWERKAGSAVTYKAIKESWFVISGETGGKVFYHRTISVGDRLISF